ncbi:MULTISPECIES: hypothetical protein [Streptomyces]|uniref:Uncharacterized protein n=1 Tax=Streptomyces clavifer TaxID=68188 RepID=A0ABS4VI53_9ACTN|nr:MULTISPECIES: hypothetical protein [Streptomyces]MBP2363586.1 hypothetical protein [Streptomyces clavifer]MDX2748432.1 hypothetical protein [Streptomyces sp. NRRL_B-2557]
MTETVSFGVDLARAAYRAARAAAKAAPQPKRRTARQHPAVLGARAGIRCPSATRSAGW